MALSRLKVWLAGEVLTAADLNGEINNILNNGVDLWSPATKVVDINGFELILDANGDTSVTADTDNQVDFRLGGTDLFRLKTVASAVNGIDFFGAATGSRPYLLTFGSDTNVDFGLRPKGTSGNVVIEDGNGNEVLIGGDAVASAVNELTISNAATGNAPRILASGGDTNISINLVPKGSGTVQMNGTGIQPLDADLTSLSAASQTNALYYRSAADTWSPVTIGFGVTFSGGTLSSAAFPYGVIYGLTLSNNGSDATNDIDIASGYAADSTGAAVMNLASAITKRLDAAWAVGTNQGGLDTGSIANTTYHVWLIQRSDTSVVDALFSASATSPTMPTNYDRKRRIGSILRESAAIAAFSQFGDEFRRSASVLDVNVTNPGDAAITRTLSVPTGVKVDAIINIAFDAGAGSTIVYLSPLDVSDEAASAAAAPLGNIGMTDNADADTRMFGQIRIRTNTSAQIRSRLQGSNATANLFIATLGWIDTRGRDG